MAKKNIYVDLDLNQQEVKNFAIEKLAAHPTGGDLFEGRIWQLTTDDHIYYYLNATTRQIVSAEDLNKYGVLQGGHDTSGGLTPVTGSGTDEAGVSDGSIEAGDSWRITTAGTITGLASGADDLAVGDLLIALIDSPASAADYMAVQLNLDDGVIDEVQNFANLAALPGTGATGVIYITNDTDLAYIWDGAAYVAVSTTNISHAVDLAAFPATGDSDIIYIADDTDFSYFWDGTTYITLAGSTTNIYSSDGVINSHRTMAGAGYNFTITGVGDYTIVANTHTLTTVGNSTETIGANKVSNVTGSNTANAAGHRVNATGAGNNVVVTTDSDGALVVPIGADPDTDVTAPSSGMIKYDSTDNEFRFYENSAWRTFSNITHAANLAAFPATGNTGNFYIADDTDLVYFWDGATYQLVGGGSLYTNNGTLTSARTVNGGGFAFIINNSSAITLQSTGNGVTIQDISEGGIITVIDEILMVPQASSTSLTLGSQIQMVTGGGEVSVNTTNGATIGAAFRLTLGTGGWFNIPANADPDTNVAGPINGVISYDSTDHEFRAYINGAWTTLIPATTASKYAEDTVCLAATAKTITHNLGTTDVSITCYDSATGGQVIPDTVNNRTANTIDIIMNIAGTYRTVTFG